MTLASHALAPEFTYTSAGAGLDVELSFTAGTSPVGVTIPTGTYRMALAPSASDLLRVIATAINAASAGAGHTNDVVSLTVDANGTAVYTFTGGVSGECDGVAFSTSLQRILAFASSFGPPIDNSYVVRGSRPVWHLALLTAATGPYWQPMQAGGAEQTTGGRVYAIASTLTSWQRSLKVHFQPTTPALRASHGCDATAMYPAEEYMDALGSTTTAREWSVLDVLYSARNALCGYTSSWGTARTSTSESIWRVYVAPDSLLSTRTELLRPEWLAFCEWELGLVAPSTTPTETRA